MGSISANGGKGGDSYDGGIGGHGGDGGNITMINLGITNLGNLIMNGESKIIIQKFDEVIAEVEKDTSLDQDKKSKIVSVLTNLKNTIAATEPYVGPFIVKVLEGIASNL